jgi:hypothetical protein
MIVWLLCYSLAGGLPQCDPHQYDNLRQCQLDGQFRAHIYQRWMEYRWVCDKRTEI